MGNSLWYDQSVSLVAYTASTLPDRIPPVLVSLLRVTYLIVYSADSFWYEQSVAPATLCRVNSVLQPPHSVRCVLRRREWQCLQRDATDRRVAASVLEGNSHHGVVHALEIRKTTSSQTRCPGMKTVLGFKLTLERVSRNEWATFRPTSMGFDYDSVFCDLEAWTIYFKMLGFMVENNVIGFCWAMEWC